MQTTTLDEIHRDPAILDRAIAKHEPLEIFQAGRLAARMVPEAVDIRETPAAHPLKSLPKKLMPDGREVVDWRGLNRLLWGDRTFSEAEVRGMRTAQDRAS